ncbi:putative alpha/beta hydrolase [Mycolicibacterium sp. CBM1]
MTAYPQLVHISVGALIGEAGGDPWKVDQTVQSGDPGAIADLGRAFYSAGACTSETFKEFEQARIRFQASWDRENGEHPINDSDEVKRATTRLMVQQDQLPAIGTDLTYIAANLAETQRFSGMQVENLNTQLHYIDALIGQALANDQDASVLEDNAIAATSGVLHQVEALRDDYSAKLEASLTDLRAGHGYDPAPIEDVDGDSELGPEQRGRESTDYYDANQRAQDEALANSSDPMTPEKASAAARLRDFATATNPGADADARRLAGERLDDFRMAHFTGPLPKDPVLGGDTRTRAQSRLDLQRKLEQGLYGLPPMSADQATQQLDEGEQFARSLTVKQAVNALEHQGMSPAGAAATVSELSDGVTLADLTKGLTTYGGAAASGIEVYGDTASTGRHAVGALSGADAEALTTIGKRMGAVGAAIEIVMAGRALEDGAPMGQTIGETAGSIGGGYLAGVGAWALAGSAIGPEGAAAAAVVGAIVIGFGGGKFGGWVGSQFDN